MKLFKKLAGAMAISMAFASGAAFASPFYQNVNAWDTSPVTNPPAATDGKTGIMDEMQVNWKATSVYTDTNGSGGVNVGDAVVDSGAGTVGGYLLGGINLLGFEATEGLGLYHSLNFDYSNMTGNVVMMLSASQILAHYTSGTIDLWGDKDADGGKDIKLLTLNVFNSDGTIGNFNIYSTVAYAAPGVWFFPPATDWSTSVVTINSRIDTNLDKGGVPALQPDGTYMRTSLLNGSVEFVPEPASIALMGLGLLGLGLSRRNKKAA
jgi:hypothetical protein